MQAGVHLKMNVLSVKIKNYHIMMLISYGLVRILVKLEEIPRVDLLTRCGLKTKGLG